MVCLGDAHGWVVQCGGDLHLGLGVFGADVCDVVVESAATVDFRCGFFETLAIDAVSRLILESARECRTILGLNGSEHVVHSVLGPMDEGCSTADDENEGGDTGEAEQA